MLSCLLALALLSPARAGELPPERASAELDASLGRALADAVRATGGYREAQQRRWTRQLSANPPKGPSLTLAASPPSAGSALPLNGRQAALLGLTYMRIEELDFRLLSPAPRVDMGPGISRQRYGAARTHAAAFVSFRIDLGGGSRRGVGPIWPPLATHSVVKTSVTGLRIRRQDYSLKGLKKVP